MATKTQLTAVILLGIIFLFGSVVAWTQLSETISFNKENKNTLTLMGITNPTISSCIKIDEFNCKANIYDEGINKDIEIVTKYCEEYELEYYDGSCLNYSYTTEQECINLSNETCLEYEEIQIQGECINFEILNRTTSNCTKWKVLTQEEIETEMKIETEKLLNEISQIQLNRNKIKEELTNEIQIEIKTKIGEII